MLSVALFSMGAALQNKSCQESTCLCVCPKHAFFFSCLIQDCKVQCKSKVSSLQAVPHTFLIVAVVEGDSCSGCLILKDRATVILWIGG
jgi:hypothetical protein